MSRRLCLITGASAGIGAAMARTAARVFCDGRILWVESADLSHASTEDLRTLHGIIGMNLSMVVC
mgnify:CR=1 FL=1